MSRKDQILTFKMMICTKKIEQFNNGEIELYEDEVWELEQERINLLNEYYSGFGDNIVSIG